MKAIAYSIKPFEEKALEAANLQRHSLTFFSGRLEIATAEKARGYEAVLVFTNDDVSAEVIERLASLGVRGVMTRSTGTDHIDQKAAAAFGLMVYSVPSYSPEAIAEHALAMALALNRHLIESYERTRRFDFRNDGLIGFTFHGKIVGIIGLGDAGMAAARIFNGMGCRVIGYDPVAPSHAPFIQWVSMDELLARSDVITLHLPLNPSTKYLICTKTLNQMKKGVMLINTSRGAILHTQNILEALENKVIGYLGLDVYEFEKGLFFENHSNDPVKDPLLEKLMSFPNVLVTPHQAYLTIEAIEEIAKHTLENLDSCSKAITD